MFDKLIQYLAELTEEINPIEVYLAIVIRSANYLNWYEDCMFVR